MTRYSRPVKIHSTHIQNILITAIPLQPLYIKSYQIIRKRQDTYIDENCSGKNMGQ